MLDRLRLASLPLAIVVALAATGLPRPVEAGVTQSALAIAGPLAEQFGVPVSAVTGLLESGISLDSVTQLLLVAKSSDSKLDDVTKLYRDQGSDIKKTADKLDVAADDYSQEKVTAALDQAKASTKADATERATDEANKALGSALGGLKR